MAVNPVQELDEKLNWHWRNTMRPVRFFGVDARAAFPFLILIVYARLSTLIFAVLSTVTFLILEKYGLTFSAALRRLRTFFTGPDRPALMTFRRRTLKDYG